MSFGDEKGWKSWRDIRKWCEENEYKNIVKRMDLNNECWNSSGEFGRCQVAICDNLRNSGSEDEAHEIAGALDESFAENYGLW
jgi:hypothetical protein